MSVNKTKDQKGRVNTKRITEGQKRVKSIKPTNPSGHEGGQKRVVRNPKGKGK
jgi:hypothetical protein